MTAAEALEVMRATHLHPDADRHAAVSAFAALEARLVQLERVAELARPVAGVNHPGAAAYERLAAALAELDRQGQS